MIYALREPTESTQPIGRAPALEDLVIRGEAASRHLPQEDFDFRGDPTLLDRRTQRRRWALHQLRVEGFDREST
jgi:hypothetical protein